MHITMKWDDLKIISAVGDSGSFSGAARALGMDHSSISRRMRAFEESHHLRLFERQAHGLELTTEGEELCESANRMADEARSIERQLAGLDTELKGTIRFATLDSTGRTIMPLLDKFVDLHPGIELHISLSQSLANLTRNEADVVLRATNRPPETFVGRHVATHHFAVFASRERFPDSQGERALADYPWVLWVNGFTDNWMKANIPDARCSARVDTALAMVEAVRSGLGIGHLACLAGDADPGFCRLAGPDTDMNLQMWILYHQDLRRNARVRSFCDFLAEELRLRRDLIEGRRPNGINTDC